jgi:DNA repair ATPase RecN
MPEITTENILQKYNSFRSYVDQRKGQKIQLEKTIKDLKGTMKQDLDKEKLFVDTGAFLQELNIQRRETTVTKIENIVTEALQEILNNENIEFKIIFEAKRQTVNSEFKIFNKITKSEYDILTSRGGALAHIAGIVLKIIITKLLGLEHCLVFDESATFLDDENVIRFAEFLQKVSKQLDIQIIFVTHIKPIISAADNVIRINYKNGESYVETNEV